MAEESPDTKFEEEITEIEDRARKRNVFIGLSATIVLILATIVVVGARERARLAAEAARPKFEEVFPGAFLTKASGQAVFEQELGLTYVQGIADAEVTPSTEFVRPLEYDQTGNPIEIPEGIRYWSTVSADSLPYVIEPIENPLIGVSLSDYERVDLGSSTMDDYGSGGPEDWQPFEQERTSVVVIGQPVEAEDAVYLVDEENRARLSGARALSGLDSLEMEWAIGNRAPLAVFGRISSTPRATGRAQDVALFVMVANAVHPARSLPGLEAEEEPAPAESETAASDTTPPAP